MKTQRILFLHLSASIVTVFFLCSPPTQLRAGSVYYNSIKEEKSWLSSFTGFNILRFTDRMESKILTEFRGSFSSVFELPPTKLSMFFNPVIEINVFPFCKILIFTCRISCERVGCKSSSVCVISVSTLPCKTCVYAWMKYSYMFMSYLYRGSSTENIDFRAGFVDLYFSSLFPS